MSLLHDLFRAAILRSLWVNDLEMELTFLFIGYADNR